MDLNEYGDKLPAAVYPANSIKSSYPDGGLDEK
jgi:hypothetical protein